MLNERVSAAKKIAPHLHQIEDAIDRHGIDASAFAKAG